MEDEQQVSAPDLSQPTAVHHEMQLEGVVRPMTKRTMVVMLEWEGDVTHEGQLELLRQRMAGSLVDRYPVKLTDSSGAFEQQLESLINKFSLESASMTPDFILASHLRSCLDNWNTHIKQRDKWWSANIPSGDSVLSRPTSEPNHDP
jgi:hypothetical protein